MRQLCVSLVCLTVLAGTASDAFGQAYAYDWASALSEKFRYDDMAEKVFTELSNSGTADRKTEGLLGLAKLLRTQARRAETAADKERLNKESLDKLKSVVSTQKRGSLRYYEAQLEIADTRQEIAAEVIDLVEDGRVAPDQLDALRKNAVNGLDQSEPIYESAASALWDADRDKENEKWRLGRRARLNSAILKLYKAELIATDPKKRGGILWQDALDEGRTSLQDFIWEHEDSAYGYYGYLWLGRILQQFADAKVGGVSPRDVDATWSIISDTVTPLEAEEKASRSSQSLSQRAYWWNMRFLNRHGATARVIEIGEDFRNRWKQNEYAYDIYGRMGQVELARAYQEEGRSAEALSLTTSVSRSGGYPGRQADRLTSVVIRTTVDASQFEPQILAAGANGAFQAGRGSSADAEAKNREAIELYQLVIQNLTKIDDMSERDYLGALSWYRIGTCLDRLGRKLEAALAFRQGYKKFNSDKIREDAKLTSRLGQSWRFSARDYKRRVGGEIGQQLENEARDWAIAHPPKSATGTATSGGVQLQWNKADGLFRQKKFDQAAAEFKSLAARPSEFQERAMVRLGQCNTKRLKAKGDATAEEWVAATTSFVDYRSFVAANPIDDPDRVKQRGKALEDADYQISQCYINAANAEVDANRRRAHYRKVIEVTEGFEDRSRNPDLVIYALYNRFQAQFGLNELAAAAEVFEKMNALAPTHDRTITAAVRTAGVLRKRYKSMKTDTEEQQAAADAIKLQSGEYYRMWLNARNPKKPGNWRLVYNIFFELEKWDVSYNLIDRYVKKFEGTKSVSTKDVFAAKRKLARTVLERAKAAYNEDRKAESGKLFNEAAGLYDELLADGSPVPKSTTILGEAAEIYGGFLVGPNNRGQYSYFPGNANFKRALETWSTIEKRSQRKMGAAENAADERKWAYAFFRAKFYKFLMFFKKAETENDRNGFKKLRSSIDSTILKYKSMPRDWQRKYRWLNQQL